MRRPSCTPGQSCTRPSPLKDSWRSGSSPKPPASPLRGARPERACAQRGLHGLCTAWRTARCHPSAALLGSSAPAIILSTVIPFALCVSYVAVLDGQHLEDGPVATVHFDHPIPVTFHGGFAAASCSSPGARVQRLRIQPGLVAAGIQVDST